MKAIRRFSVALSLSALLTAGLVVATPAPVAASSGPALTRFCTSLSNTITELRSRDGKLAQALANLLQHVYDDVCK